MTDSKDLLEGMILSDKTHIHPNDGMCAMELVSWLMMERFSDNPACVSWVCREVFQILNDGMPQKARNRLLPYLPRIVGTSSDKNDDKREDFLIWFLIRDVIPENMKKFAYSRKSKESLDLLSRAKTLKEAENRLFLAMVDIVEDVKLPQVIKELRKIGDLGMDVIVDHQDSFLKYSTPANVMGFIVECQSIWKDDWKMAFRCIEGLLEVGPTIEDGFSDTPEHLFHMARGLMGAPELRHSNALSE